MQSITCHPRSAKGIRSAAAITVAVAVLATACGGSDSSGEASSPDTVAASEVSVQGTVSGPPDDSPPVAGGSIVWGIEAEPGGIDATRYAFSSSGHMVASAVFDPLAKLDENGDAVPYLASSIDPNADNTVWTITLPEGVTFHDGTPLDGEAVAKNLEAHRTSTITAAGTFAITDVAFDGLTATVTLDRPYARFPLILSTQIGYVMAPVMIDDAAYALKPVGTGPFIFSGHEPDKEWKFAKNTDYWRDGLPYLDAITFRSIPDNSERIALLSSGDLDVTYTQRPQEVQQLRADENIKQVEYASGDEAMLVLNTSKAPFDSLTARQAVAYATDSATWRAEKDNVEGAANGPFAPGQLGYAEDNGFPKFDMTKAKELVTQYETETGTEFEFSFTTQADVDNLADADFFKALYEEAGMTVTVTSIPQINLVATIATGNYEMGRFRLFNQPDPDADSQFWRSSSIGELVSLNFPRYVNEDMDATIDKALATSDDAERDALYQEMNTQLATDLPYIWLGRSVWVLAAEPRVNGIYAAANGSLQTVGGKTWIAELWLSR